MLTFVPLRDTIDLLENAIEGSMAPRSCVERGHHEKNEKVIFKKPVCYFAIYDNAFFCVLHRKKIKNSRYKSV